MKWKCKIIDMIGKQEEMGEKVSEFLNTLPEEVVLEAKVSLTRTLAWIWYRE